MTKYTINELANSKGVSPLVREALLQMEAELEATNRQVEILSDALAESRREVAAKDEALKLALEALESERDKYLDWGDEDGAPEDVYDAITAIKQALAAPVQDNSNYRLDPPGLDALYTTPPAAQRQWVGLTDDEMYLNCPNWLGHEQCKTWVQQIEAKLKEKNT